MKPAIDLSKGEEVYYLGRLRRVTSVSHHDADGLSLVRFEDGRWAHCAPDFLFRESA